ncbi:cytosine deaminase [Ancylobacter sp. WKF20]|uniref:cytosine deaminase n=1 Tax=Ancylobacter sp. WKF20 TaxID=3039801 RepID=UPI0024342AA5|nr:cytosine deaminase [Ancylobacter sp. WKF20]WGD28556.1 cytosine deaminase [Ancylobacter sp. WKF20]
MRELDHLPPAYLLTNARVPACLIGAALPADSEGLVRVDIAVAAGRITAIGAALERPELPRVPLNGCLVLPGLVDVHTHLDKAFIWPRAQNADGSFAGALAAADADRRAHWTADDVRTRMDFALRCAYAHGTVAIRTHLDSIGPQTALSWPVFAELREAWRGRIALQAVALTPIDLVLDDGEFLPLLDAVRRHRGVLGAVTYMSPALPAGLDRLFAAASAHGLELDFHVDETADPGARSLALIAEAALRHGFEGRILTGHCCSLARQSEDAIDRTLDLVARAGVAVVSLPMCNLYLQDRQAGRTPRWRGITLLHEMKARGIEVMVASDNARDPFYAYGDLDLVEVYREATRIAHLDHPFADWPAIVASTPAALMGLAAGRIAVDHPADLIILTARSLNQALARPQADRIVLRDGARLDAVPPDYAELDSLKGMPHGL